MNESLEVERQLRLQEVPKDEAMDDLHSSTNKGSLAKVMVDASADVQWGIHYRILYGDVRVGNIGICDFTDLRQLERWQYGVTTALDPDLRPFTAVVTYLEIMNDLRNSTGVNPVDMLLSVFHLVRRSVAAEGYECLLCGGKTEREDRLYMRGGFRVSELGKRWQQSNGGARPCLFYPLTPGAAEKMAACDAMMCGKGKRRGKGKGTDCK